MQNFSDRCKYLRNPKTLSNLSKLSLCDLKALLDICTHEGGNSITWRVRAKVVDEVLKSRVHELFI